MLKLRQEQEKRKQERNNDHNKNQITNTLLTPSRIRIGNDIKNLDLPSTIQINFENSINDMSQEPKLNINVKPDEGIYKNGNFKFQMMFNELYPIEPPSINCLNKIFHPNIDLQGKICLNILREDWSPVLDIQSILIGLLFLFLEPSWKDPLNIDAGKLLKENLGNFSNFVNRTMHGDIMEGVKYDKVI